MLGSNLIFSSPSLLSSNSIFDTKEIWTLSGVFYKVRRSWKWYRYKEIYGDPKNFLGLIGGNALSYVVPTFVKIPAISFYAGSLLLDLFKQQDTCFHAWSQWKQAVYGVHPINAYPTYIQKSKTAFFSSHSTITWWMSASKHGLIRTQRIACSSFHLGFELFKLTMRVMDLMDLVTLDPNKIKENAEQAFREGAVHGPKVLKALSKNKIVFTSRLRQIEPFATKALKACGAPENSFKTLETSLNSFFSSVESWLGWYDNVSTTSGEAFTDLGAKALHDIAPTSLQKYIPVNRNSWWNPHAERKDNKPSISYQKIILRPYRKQQEEREKAKGKSIGDQVDQVEAAVYKSPGYIRNMFDPEALKQPADASPTKTSPYKKIKLGSAKKQGKLPPKRLEFDSVAV